MWLFREKFNVGSHVEDNRLNFSKISDSHTTQEIFVKRNARTFMAANAVLHDTRRRRRRRRAYYMNFLVAKIELEKC